MHTITVATMLRRENIGGKEPIAAVQAEDSDVLESGGGSGCVEEWLGSGCEGRNGRVS